MVHFAWCRPRFTYFYHAIILVCGKPRYPGSEFFSGNRTRKATMHNYFLANGVKKERAQIMKKKKCNTQAG